MEDTCTVCGRGNLQVTVTFDRHDVVSILRALGEVCDDETLKILGDALKAR